MANRTIAVLLAAALAACGLPRDPEGTLDRVRGGTLRVGVVENPPWTVVRGGRVEGVEAEILRRVADTLGARIEWVRGTESEHLEALERFELDAVAGGLTRSSPWRRRVAFTRPYHGDRVIALPPGENAWLVRMEDFLYERRSEIARLASGRGEGGAP